jgi:hypothetical protein
LTTLGNSVSMLPLVVLTIRPRCSVIFGSYQPAAKRFEAFERAFFVRAISRE